MTAELTAAGLPRRQYEHPPVLEAMARLHWDEPIPWKVTLPGLLFNRVEDLYPDEPQVQNQMEAEIGPGENPQTPNFQFKSSGQRVLLGADEGARRLAVGTNDISAHGLPPYEGWEALEARLFEAFERLGGMLGRDRFTNLGVRYINKFVIPETTFDFEKYMTIAFSMPPGWPGHVRSFIDRVECGYPDGKSKITFTWATADADEGTSAFIVDLDLVMVADEDQPWSLAEAREQMAELKARETQAFESLLQDGMREVFGEVG